jgi:hypothetical protein
MKVRRALVSVGLVLAAATAVAAIGCGKPKAGDACEKGRALCQDDKTELSCQGGKYLAAPCKGAKGCYTQGQNLFCDISGNAAGDVCSTDDEGNAACSADAKGIIVCEKGKYVVRPCRGPSGCKTSGDTAECDTSVGELGDPCSGTGYACSVDRKSLLQCKDGKAVLDEKCESGQSCKSEGDKVGCM